MKHGFSPGARPLIVDVGRDLCDAQAGHPILVGPPLVALSGVRRHPAKGLCGLRVWHLSRKHRHEGMISHDVREGDEGSGVVRDVGRVKSRAQVG